MPDGGMWNMRMHNKFGNPFFSDKPCPDCGSTLDHDNTNYNAGTGELGANGVKRKATLRYCDDDYHRRARERNYKRRDKLYIETKARLLDTAPAQEVIAFIQSRKSEFGQSIPMTRRETVHVEGEKVDEGWVYVFKCYTSLENHPWVRWVYKIGKTYPDGIGGRMSTARGFARVDFIDKFWFEEAEVSEKEVHTILEPFNLRTLGYTNCGKEMFMCSLEQAVSAINEVEKIGNTKEQAVG